MPTQQFRLTIAARFILAITLAVFGAASCVAGWPVERGNAQATAAVKANLPKQLELIWDFADGGAFEATPVIADSYVYVADADGGVYCLRINDGTVAWKTTVESGFLAAPAVSDGAIVLGDYDGLVYAFSTKDGKQLWKYQTDGQIDSGATFYKKTVLVTSQDGTLTSLRLADGSVRWKYETSDQIRCSPTVAGDRTFLGGCDSKLHIVDLNTGKQAVEPMPLESPTNSTPAVVADLAFLPTYGGRVLAFHWQQGKQAWSYEDPDRKQEYRSSAAATADTVVVSSQGKQLVALNAQTGEPRWQTSIRRYADSSPVIAGDSVFLAATDGRLYRFDLASGKETWQYEVKGALLAAPAIADNKLILTTEEGHVLCFGEKK